MSIKFITGYAGTGKSHELAARANEKTLVMVPTHKAAAVLDSRGIKAVTIYSALKLVPVMNENFRKGQKIQTLKEVGDHDLAGIADIFIDEYSMIPRKVFEHLLSVIPDHCNITVFGDPYQLPPVDGKKVKAKDYADEIINLTKQYRSDAPEVVETYTRFVEYIKNGKGDLSVDLPRGSLKDFNPDTDVALAFTNEKVAEMNKKIAKHCEPTDEIVINKVRVEMTSIECLSSGLLYPSTMSRGKLVVDEKVNEAVTESISKWRTDLSSYKKMNIVLDDGSVYTIYGSVDHYKLLKKAYKDIEKYQNLVRRVNGLDDEVDLPGWCRENRQAPHVKERGAAWSHYMTLKNYVFDIRGIFASTTHQAQGGEWPRVFIAMDDLKKAGDKYPRLMYVALSRAIKEVIIVP